MKIKSISLLLICFFIGGCVTTPQPTGEIRVHQSFEKVSRSLLEYLRAEVGREANFFQDGYLVKAESVSPTFTILNVHRHNYDIGTQGAFFSVDIIGEGNSTLVRLREGQPSYTKKENISTKVKLFLTDL